MTPGVLRQLAHERDAQPLRWMYLSFASDDAFLGAAIVYAHGIADAANVLAQRGINPGGQVLAADVPDEHLPPEKYRGRLLTKADIQEFWPDSKSIKEWKSEGREVVSVAVIPEGALQ